MELVEVDCNKVEQEYAEITASNFEETKYHSPNTPTDITSAGTPILMKSVTSNLRSFTAGEAIPPDIGSLPQKRNLVKPDDCF